MGKIVFSVFSVPWTEQVREAISSFSIGVQTSQIGPRLRHFVREDQSIGREAAATTPSSAVITTKSTKKG